MKLSFSTLGAPDWSFDELLSTAADLGFDGIEVRGIADEIYAPAIREFSAENIAATKAKLERKNISIPMLTPGEYLDNNAKLDEAEENLTEYIKIAAALGTPYIRVMGEPTAAPGNVFDYDTVLAAYKRLCAVGEKYGVTMLIETNGALADSALCARLVDEADSAYAGALWDIHHTYRYFGESPKTTVRNLGSYIRHTHVKDSVRGSNGKITYMLNGYGDVPIDDAVKSLSEIGYKGYLSYEWVKRWSRELAEPGVAFYSYISYMRGLIN